MKIIYKLPSSWYQVHEKIAMLHKTQAQINIEALIIEKKREDDISLHMGMALNEA